MPRCLACGKRWVGVHSGCAGAGASPSPDSLGAEAPAPLPSVSGYRVERLVARGGFGTIFAGRAERNGSPVAIKLAHADKPLAAASLEREGQALLAIGPPTVPALYDAGALESGVGYLVMEWVEAPTLAQRLAELSAPMPLPELSERAFALVDALEAVHARGYVHADLKPENVLIDGPFSGAKLIDLGLAQRIGPPTAASAGDEPGLVPVGSSGFAGTAEYMAPEQCTGQATLDERTDVYALGIILYELLTARPPFIGLPGSVVQAHLTHRPVPPSKLEPTPPALESLVLRALAKEPSRRFESMRALRAALREALAGQSLAPAASAPRPRVPLTPGPLVRRSVAVLFLDTTANAMTVQAALRAYGGHLAHASGMRAVGVFDPETGENPARHALRAAMGLTLRGLAACALLDLARVAIQRRPSGEPRFLSTTFSRKDLPLCEGNGDVRLTAEAVEVLPEVEVTPVPGHPGLSCILRSGLTPSSSSPPPRTDDEALVGRDRELAALLWNARLALQDRAPTIVTVTGEAGHGKSVLAAALRNRLSQELPGARILALRAREPLPGEGGEAIPALLAQLLDLPSATSATPSDEGRALIDSKLDLAFAEELRLALASIAGWLPKADETLGRMSAAPGGMHALHVRAMGEALRATARRAPVCLMLDDAHFADASLLDALEYACLEEAQVPLWVCALVRPGFDRSRPGWGTRAARQGSIHLAALDLASAEELCRRLLYPAANVPNQAITRIVERTERVPLFLVELVQGLKRQGLVRRHASGDAWYLATEALDLLPELPLVEWLAERELHALPAELLPHARLCALLGPELLISEVEGVVRELERDGDTADFPLDPDHATRRLIDLGLLAWRQHGAIAFRNPLLREAVSAAAPESWRARLHLAAYRFYAREPTRSSSRWLQRAAFHAAGAGLSEEAAALYCDLAEEARHRHAYLEAEAGYSRALHAIPEALDLRRLTALRGRGLMRYRVGRYEDSLKDFAEARALARQFSDVRSEVKLLLEEATALDWINDYAQSEARVEEARALLGEDPSPLLRARLLLGLGRSKFRNGQWQQACALMEEAAALAEPLGNAGYETHVVSLLMLGALLPNLGRLEDATRVMEQVEAMCTERQDLLHLGSAINNRRMLWVARKELGRALQDQARFKQLGRELGMVGWEYFAEYNQGELLYLAGSPEDALPHALRALDLERLHPEIAPRPWAALLLARICAYVEDAPQARERLDEIRQMLARARSEGRQAELSPSEAVLASMVELSTRDASPEEWRALRVRAEYHSVEQEPLEVLELMGLSALRQGRASEAVRILTDACRLAERIPTIMDARLYRSLERALAASR